MSAIPTATILIVDDEPSNLSLLASLLQPHFRVLAANRGEHALCIAGTEPRPDLVLLDVMMPDMDGHEILRRLRAAEASAGIPVIFVTALSDEWDEERGLKEGAVDYISKPIKPATLLARVQTHVELKRNRDRLRAQNRDLDAEVKRRQKEKERIQLQLLQSEKLSAIGQLAAGVAHEINNPVGFVHSNLGILDGYLLSIGQIIEAYRALDPQALDRVPGMAAVRELEQQTDLDYLLTDIRSLIGESTDGLNRVRSIIDDMRGLSRQSENQWEWADLHQGLESTLNIVWNQLKYHCELHKDYGELPSVRCLPNQLNQVFLNLLVNAAQAIEGQGHIHVRTRADGEQVWVEVEDSGTGIAEENLPQLFEPFFTTKPAGKGTGLGLSLSYGIVQRHGGSIEVRSEPGKGTCFRVTLPVQTTQDEGETQAAT